MSFATAGAQSSFLIRRKTNEAAAKIAPERILEYLQQEKAIRIWIEKVLKIKLGVCVLFSPIFIF